MTASVWDEATMESNGWWMTEKYDGMRLFWNGSQFYTRLGTKMKVPASVTSQLPNVALDGELWTQYGLYQDAVNLSVTQSAEKWEKAIFWVFDAPSIGDKPFEERIEYLRKLKEDGKLPSFVKIVETIKCKSETLKKNKNNNNKNRQRAFKRVFRVYSRQRWRRSYASRAKFGIQARKIA